MIFVSQVKYHRYDFDRVKLHKLSLLNQHLSLHPSGTCARSVEASRHTTVLVVASDHLTV